MGKMKTRKAMAKRVKVTGTGEFKRKHAYTGHQATIKTHKQKRHLRKSALVSRADHKNVAKQLQG